MVRHRPPSEGGVVLWWGSGQRPLEAELFIRPGAVGPDVIARPAARGRRRARWRRRAPRWPAPPAAAAGTTGTGTTPKFVANTRQSTLPAAMPIGAPTAIPTSATVVACQQTAAATWRRTNPSDFSSPVSRRRLATLTSSRCTMVAAPNSDRATPNSSGKLTDSPKLTSTVGLAGPVGEARGTGRMCRASAALPGRPWSGADQHHGGHAVPGRALAGGLAGPGRALRADEGAGGHHGPVAQPAGAGVQGRAADHAEAGLVRRSRPGRRPSPGRSLPAGPLWRAWWPRRA